MCLIPAALLLVWPALAAALPPALVGYDPAGQVRFDTPAEADAKRQELIQFIWPSGVPGTLPSVTPGVGAGVFSGDLYGVSPALVASVDRLDADVGGFDFHAISYLMNPSTPAG